MWWIWLVVGVLWIIASLVILQFDQASFTRIVGIMSSSRAHSNWCWQALPNRIHKSF
jgi:hypothetical protein